MYVPVKSFSLYYWSFVDFVYICQTWGFLQSCHPSLYVCTYLCDAHMLCTVCSYPPPTVGSGMWEQVRCWTLFSTTVRQCCTWGSAPTQWSHVPRLVHTGPHHSCVVLYSLSVLHVLFTIGPHHSCVGHKGSKGHSTEESTGGSQSSCQCSGLWWSLHRVCFRR